LEEGLIEMNPATIAAAIVGSLLAALGLRRIYLAAAAFGPIREWPTEATPPLLLLAPMRNEAARAHFLLRALDQLNFPPDQLHIILGDDASTDETQTILKTWANGKANVQIFIAPSPLGKAELLNRMILASPATADLIAVYDAKHAPEPGALRLLAGAMQDSQIGCAAGYLRPANASTTLVSRYAALESWVTQLIHHAANEQRGVSSPSIGGNCIYRRQAIDQAGGFPPGAFSEDTELSLAMQACGWRTRFISSAVASNQVVESVSTFWRQRLRWSRGLSLARKHAAGLRQKRHVLGYLDRLIFLAAAAMAVFGFLPWWVLIAYALTPLFMIAAAIHRADAWRDLPAIALAVLLCAPLDILVSVWAALPFTKIKWR
jgi:cellulose synthase/poly-beta-1,6-N-acetylglucosamine synthase-like glycosyltransferase